MSDKKAPIGIMPEYLWNEKRLFDIICAINRYLEAKKEIPTEWIEEYNRLI